LPRQLPQVALQLLARRSQGCEVRASSCSWTPCANFGSPKVIVSADFLFQTEHLFLVGAALLDSFYPSWRLQSVARLCLHE
jgi:hypothetical protein